MKQDEFEKSIDFLRRTEIGKLALAYSVTQVLESYGSFDPVGAFDYLMRCIEEKTEPLGFYPFLPYRNLTWREIVFSIIADAISFYQAIDESLGLLRIGLKTCIESKGPDIDLDTLDFMQVAEIGALVKPGDHKKPILSIVR